LGVDYHIRLTMTDSSFGSDIRTMPQRQVTAKPGYSIKDNKITLIIEPQALQFPATPVFVVAAAEKWSNRGKTPTVLLAADNAPNIGHYTVSTGELETKATTQTASATMAVIVTAASVLPVESVPAFKGVSFERTPEITYNDVTTIQMKHWLHYNQS
jgi:hypothetical protein